VIPVAEFRTPGEVTVKVGDRVEVVIEMLEDGTGETRLSREKPAPGVGRPREGLRSAIRRHRVMTGKVKAVTPSP
jgi:small subunit ribosomal protein S1